MTRLKSVLSPMITAAGVLALSGVGLAQSPSGSHREASARTHEFMSSAPCPLARVTKEKITEEQARDLAQAFADKNWQGFKVVRPAGYGGGYTTMCYQTAQALAVQSSKVTTGTTTKSERSDVVGSRPPTIGTRNPEPTATDLRTVGALAARPLVIYSVEYSMDLKNPAGETRNVCVDQYGFITEFCGDFAMAGATGPIGPAGPAGPIGPAGAMGAQGPAGTAGAQPQASAAKPWSTFRDFLFDFDKSEIRSNETKHVADIAAYMKQNPSARVGIDGHTDPRGTDAFNQGLSERRVNNIRDALVSAGVADGRINVGAFGESQPKCNESTEACWQSDRRVEVLIGNAQTASR